MAEDEMLLVIGAMMVLGFGLYYARTWFFRAGFGGGRAMRISRIVENDGHLDFDQRLAQRLAQRLGELERERDAGPSPPPAPSQPPATPTAPAPSGFGRRGL